MPDMAFMKPSSALGSLEEEVRFRRLLVLAPSAVTGAVEKLESDESIQKVKGSAWVQLKSLLELSAGLGPIRQICRRQVVPLRARSNNLQQGSNC